MSRFKPRSTHIILPLLALGAVLSASPAAAQNTALRGWGPGMMMGPGMMNWRVMGRTMCDPSAAGLAEWRFDRVETVIHPTDEQRLLLTGLKAASTKAVESISAACPRDLPQSPAARLEVMEKRLEVMLDAVKTVRPAFEAFYASLTDEQKSRFNSIGPRSWGWRRWLWPWSQG
jgi:LTXXQ motif family protein